MGSRPTTTAGLDFPGAATWWTSPVLRTLTRPEPSGSMAIDHGRSSPPSSAVTAGADVVAAALTGADDVLEVAPAAPVALG